MNTMAQFRLLRITIEPSTSLPEGSKLIRALQQDQSNNVISEIGVVVGPHDIDAPDYVQEVLALENPDINFDL